MRYSPEKAGNWKSSEFLQAAQAEGVPISKERYARLGKSKRMLSETPIFTTLDRGGDIWKPAAQLAGSEAQTICGSPKSSWSLGCAALPPFTKVSERFVRECAAALRNCAGHRDAARAQKPLDDWRNSHNISTARFRLQPNEVLMEVLVTGVAGFIGVRVALRLLQTGHNVTGVPIT